MPSATGGLGGETAGSILGKGQLLAWKGGLPESSPSLSPPQAGSQGCDPDTETGSPGGEATDKLASDGELSKALLSEVGATVSMGLSMGGGVSKFKSIG